MPYLPDVEVADELAYSLHLRKLNESSLSDDVARDSRVIRFTWLRSFGHPVVLRVDIDTGGTGQLHMKAGGGRGGQLTNDITRPLGANEIETLLTLLASGDFWGVPSKEALLGMDGEEWILEVRERERYHYIKRWCPQDGVAYHVGQYLATLAGEDFERLR
jgi:hypothetical protein